MFNTMKIRVRKEGPRWLLEERRWFIWWKVRESIFGSASLWASADTIYGERGWAYYGERPSGEMEITIQKDKS